MKKILDFIGKHPGWATLILFSIFLIAPLMMNILFKWDSGCSIIQAEWSAGDGLSYVGTFLSTFIAGELGVMSLWQNVNFKEEAAKKEELLRKMELEKLRLTNMPQFSIRYAVPENIIDFDVPASNDDLGMHFAVKRSLLYVFDMADNVMDWLPQRYYRTDMDYLDGKLISILNCGKETAHDVHMSITVDGEHHIFKRPTSIQKDQEIFFFLKNPHCEVAPRKILLVIVFSDCFQNIYNQRFEINLSPGKVDFSSSADVVLRHPSPSMNLNI